MTLAFDDSEVRALSEILGRASTGTLKEVRQVVAKGALNIKQDAQRGSRGLPHARLYPFSIGYDMTVRATEVSAEIGPDKDKEKLQGALGNLIEYGSANNPPHPHIRPAADREQPKFERALEDLARKLLEGR